LGGRTKLLTLILFLSIQTYGFGQIQQSPIEPKFKRKFYIGGILGLKSERPSYEDGNTAWQPLQSTRVNGSLLIDYEFHPIFGLEFGVGSNETGLDFGNLQLTPNKLLVTGPNNGFVML